MYSASSWSSRLLLVLLALPLASACKPDPTPPTGDPDTTPPSTRANPPGGNFTASLLVTLTCEDGTGSGCAATYYTTDGSQPSASSPRYTSPVALSTSTTLKFFSVDVAGNAEAPQTQSYRVDQTAPLTVASPAGGIINSARSVALLCTDGDGTGSGCAATYYTTDGTAPTASSPRYTAPLLVSASTTLRFFSVDVVGNTEAAKTEQYTLDGTAPTVVATPAAGNYATAQMVTLSCDDGVGTGCGPIHYTTDGSVPTVSSPTYTAPLLVSANTLLRFRAVDGAGLSSEVVSAVYVIDETGPATTATPPGALYNTPVSVVLACDDGAGGTGCAATYYTTDGSPPTTGSARYTTALPITSSTPLKFFSVDKLGNPGPTGTAQYTLDFTAPVTTALPPGGTYSGAQTVVLECQDGTGAGCAATYYTLDGTLPTRGSSRYTAPLPITANTRLRFFSVDKANNAESVRTEEYDLDSVAPVTRALPAGGLYKSNQSVVLGCDDGVGSGCVETHYTVDGSPPTMASPKYTSAILLTGNTTLRFFSVDVAGNQESVRTETYTIDTVAPSTTANPAAGTYGSTVSVTLACDDGGGSGCAGTHYTVDGSAPTPSSPLYSSALSLSATTTLRYFSVDKAGNREPTRVALYTLDQVAPTVSASPRGGLYNKAQSITLTCADTGGSTCAAIHYTTDGTAPTTASATYSAPLSLPATTTLQFLAVDEVGNASGVRAETYLIDDGAPTTTATPSGGPYADSPSVTLRCGDGAGSGCTATYYTLDGSTPTSSSSTYSAPFTLSATTSLKFFSVDAAGNAEPVKTVTYVIDRDEPTVAADPPGGTYRVAQSVTLSCTDTGGSGCASIHYTTDGSPPTTGSATYSAALTVSANTTLRFLAVDLVGNTSAAQTVAYAIDTVAPGSTATPAGGTYFTAKTLALNCVDNAGGSGCAATYYTTDGSLPSKGSMLYTGPFSLSTDTTLRFFSVDAAGNSEPAKTETYTFVLDTVPPTTTAAPPAGTYGSTVSVTLACDDGAGSGCVETRYTVDGTSPGSSSPLYSGAIPITATTTLRYASQDNAGNLESVRVAAYLIDKVAPTVSASVRSGTYRTAQTVALSCSDTGGSTCDSIRYTLDGSTPSLASLTYSAPLTLSANTTLKFLAADKVGNVSGVSTESYVIDTVAPVTTAIRAGGAYGNAQSITLLCADGSGSGCTATYFTLDGSTPTTGSSRYASPISISANATLRFFSVDAAGNAESPKTEAYVIDTEIPTVTADLASGTYNSAQRVTLSCTDNPGGSGCAAIHYTTDGSWPSTSSPLYTGPLTVSANTTLFFFAVDAVGNMGGVQSAWYAIDTLAPVTSVTPPGGTYTAGVNVYLNCWDDNGSGCAATYYTTDGSTPTTSSPGTSGYFYFTATTTLKFFSVDVLGNAEPVHTETYVVVPDTTPPHTDVYPAGGEYPWAQVVYLNCSDDVWCNSIYYTLDGSEPTAASPRYSGSLYISTNTTLKFFSVDMAGNAEPVRTETYVIGSDTTPPTTSASPAGGTYTAALPYVYLNCADHSWCESTYYTLDGSNPTTASPRYTSPLSISTNTTLKFFSVDGYGNVEPVRTETYTFVPDTTPPITYASPPGGTYTSPLYVYLNCSDDVWCDSTYYTLDGSNPTTASPRYAGYLYLFSTTTLKFFSVDAAGNAEPVRTESYVIQAPPADPSAQIAYIRTLLDGTLYEHINGALVTYTKASTGPSDPAGFFLQGSAGGPALFVAIDPLTLSPTPHPGDRVSLQANQKVTVNGVVQLTRIDPVVYTVHSSGESVEPFRVDASSSDLVLDVGEYESRLISFSGTVASDFAAAGAGHVSANVVSLGNPTVNSSLKLRLTTSVQSALDVTQGCSVTTSAPLWRFNTQAQPSAWTSADLTVLSCPAPRVLGASSTSGTTVVVAFDRRIDPASVSASGGQFTFDNGLVATSATVTDRQVLLTTSSQVEGTSYRVTVAPSILDTRGSAIDGSANSASFTGYASTPTPGPAELRLSEVSPGINNGKDLVELIAVRGGSVGGYTLMLGASTLLATLPDVQVAAGDVIVVHLRPDAANGDATGSETTSKGEFPAGMYSANYDTAWDFLGSTANEIGYSRRVLRVRDAQGAVQDGAAFGRTGGTPPSDFLTQLKQLQDEGEWLPVDCGGVACSDTTTPSALAVSVDWAGCGTTRSGNSVRRVSQTDNDVRADWAVGTSSFGLANP